MRILFAAPDRDLLSGYRLLLEDCGHETATAFDGTGAVSKLANGTFDLAILDRDLPRVDAGRIVAMLNEQGVPVILLTKARLHAAQLLEPALANDYLTYPFLPAELTAAIDETARKAGSGEMFTAGDLTVDVPGFTLGGSVRLTGAEIDILAALNRGETPQTRHMSVYIAALNNKFERLNRSQRIGFLPNEGYRMVMNREQ